MAKRRRVPQLESLEQRLVFAADICPDIAQPIPSPPSCPIFCDAATDPDVTLNHFVAPSSFTTAPVNSLSGVPLISSTDLTSNGFGKSWGHTRTWSGLNNTGINGNGWAVTDQPYLTVYSTYNPITPVDNPIVGFVESGQGITLFDVDLGDSSGTWNARFNSGQTLAYNSTTDEWTLTDASGNQLTFYDLPRYGANLITTPTVVYANQGLHGKLKQRIDSDGQTTNYTYHTSGAAQDLLQTIERVDSTTGQAERFVHSYSTVSNTLEGALYCFRVLRLSGETAVSARTMRFAPPPTRITTAKGPTRIMVV